jgi:hypothetical protein
MFLTPRTVATTNRYVANGPEDRHPSFKPGTGLDMGTGILRYSTATPEKVQPVGKAAVQKARAIAKVAKASKKR